jgi:hypothetical protein
MSKSRARKFADIISGQENVPTTALGNVPPVTPTQVSDQANTSTGYLDLPSGTIAQRPSSPNSGYTRYNSDTGTIEFYDGTAWISTNLIPDITSISGNLYAGMSSTLTLNVANTTDNIDVEVSYNGSVVKTYSGVSVSSNSVTINTSSEMYGQASGSSFTFIIKNQDGTPSSSRTVQSKSLPSGGGVGTTGSKRYHVFNSSGTFTVPSGMTLTNVEYLIIAGGGGGGTQGGGGDNSAGGGAGGYRSSVIGEGSGGGAGAESTMTLSAGSYSVVVGAGGATDNNGSNSSFNGITAIGGGTENASGGSGGGKRGNTDGSGAGSGTSGQGYAGGDRVAGGNGGGWYGGGGGGANEAGNTDGTSHGGDGKTSSITGSGVSRGGGGAGGNENSSNPGNGGGGHNNGSNGTNSVASCSGAANTGGGGGGLRWGTNNAVGGDGGTGGSGVVIIRYEP